MRDYKKATREKQEGLEPEHRLSQKESAPLFDQFHAWGQDALSVGETPFQPQLEKHATALSEARSTTQLANLVLHLQRTYGNTYVQRLLNSTAIQAKLTVNAPNDIYEQEADRVAEKVVRAVNSPAQRQEEEELLEAKPASDIQHQEEEELLEAKPASDIQRQEEEELEAKPTSDIQRQEEEELEAKPTSDIQRQEEEEEGEEEEELQMQPAESQPIAVPENLESRINSESGSGQPLSGNVREPMELAFGADFSGVRVHTDSEADVLNQQLNAKAFTKGQDIFFGEGEYSPGSESGQKLIAHELTHVVQQGAASVSPEPAEAGKEEDKVAIESNTNLHKTSSEQRQARQLSEPTRRQIEWGSNAKAPDAAGIESGWSAAPSESGIEISRAASETGRTIAEPQQISWGASESLADAEGAGVIPSAINVPILTTLPALEAAEGSGTRGVAPYPANAQAPNFDFNTTEETGAKGASQWTAKPTLTQNHSEGDSQPLYLGPGLHLTMEVESGVPVYDNLSNVISQLDYGAENEHGTDYKYASKISIGEAEDVLQNHIAGKSFGPKPTSIEAEQMVLDEITSKLTHHQLGNDKTKWFDKYDDLQTKTLDRDTAGWHTFTSNNRTEIKDKKGNLVKVTYDMVQGPNMKINQVKSKDVIKY